MKSNQTLDITTNFFPSFFSDILPRNSYNCCWSCPWDVRLLFYLYLKLKKKIYCMCFAFWLACWCDLYTRHSLILLFYSVPPRILKAFFSSWSLALSNNVPATVIKHCWHLFSFILLFYGHHVFMKTFAMFIGNITAVLRKIIKMCI